MAQEPPPPEGLLLQQFTGLKNVVSEERLGKDELSVAVNIDLDDVGQPRRRRGQTLVSPGDWHSLWQADSGIVYGVKNGTLGIVDPDYTLRSIVSVGSPKLAYVGVGPDIYWASEAASGKIINNVNEAWGAFVSAGEWVSPVVNPTEYLPEVRGRLLGKPPLARYLTERNGRIYLANDRTVWATELYQFDYVDKTRSFWFFESEVTGLGIVSDGMYVGTKTALWFISGTHNEPRRVRASIAGVIHGSMVPCSPDSIAGKQVVTKGALLCMTTDGLMACFDQGIVQPMTEDKVWFPNVQDVAPLFRTQDGVTQYVAVADSRGAPTSNARIGDYVEAEIRRFQGA
jgi:hypothetical protein